MDDLFATLGIAVEEVVLNDTPDDYLKYRGKCREFSKALVEKDPSLTLVRGHYYDPHWGEQPHWWCKDKDGNIVDPTRLQFPSKGLGEYVEFDGWITCEECGKRETEEQATIVGHHTYCSNLCVSIAVGIVERPADFVYHWEQEEDNDG